MNRFRYCVLVLLPLTISTSLLASQNEAKNKQKSDDPERIRLEKEFASKLLDVVLVGRYSITNAEGEKTSKPDRYEIVKVTKVKNDYWVFYYRRSPDLVLPIPLKVLWAGDTPMITMTNEAIPALGTFSVRLLFHGNHYAGTWQHGRVGGHMWGRIEKQKQPEDTKQKGESK